jgi:hypothetical protein
MALADRLLLFGLRLLLAQTLPVTARLLAATLRHRDQRRAACRQASPQYRVRG